MDTGFNVYRNGKKITPEPVNAGTFYDDSYASPDAATYEVRPVVKGKETNRKNGRYTLPANAPTAISKYRCGSRQTESLLREIPTLFAQ